jgi:hypothetical protein
MLTPAQSNTPTSTPTPLGGGSGLIVCLRSFWNSQHLGDRDAPADTATDLRMGLCSRNGLRTVKGWFLYRRVRMIKIIIMAQAVHDERDGSDQKY